MTIRTRISAKGEKVICVHLVFRRVDDGIQERYRKDAQVQTMAGARAQEQRVISHFVQHGTIAALLTPADPEPPKATATTGPTWDDAVERFRRVTYKTGGPKGRGFKEATKRSYEIRLGHACFRALAGVPLVSIDRQFVETWEETHLLAVQPATRSCFHTLMRSVLRAFLGDEAMPRLKRLAYSDPDMPEDERVQATPLAYIDAILHESDDRCPASMVAHRVAMRLAVRVAASTGLRASELRALWWRDVDLASGILTVNAGMTGGVRGTTKSGKARQVYLNSEILDVLEHEHAKRKPQGTDHVLVRGDGKPWGDYDLARMVRSAAERLGLQMGRKQANGTKIVPLHSLRHRFGTEVARTDIVSAQKMLGHSKLEMTQRYASTDDPRKRAAVEAAMVAMRGTP